MSLHENEPVKAEVGVRELHDQLSRYVRHAQAGHEVVVTMRGHRVARLSPIGDADDPLEDLRRRGLLRDPTTPRRRTTPGTRVTATGSVSELVADQRR